MTEQYTIKRKIYDSRDPRLGRNVNHDSRSLNYLVKADPSSYKSVKHDSMIPVLDQGQLGSCTGNAATKCLSYGAFWGAGSANLSTTDAAKDEQYAVSVYSDATQVDPYSGAYPPTDTGSDGLSVAKVLKTRGLISGYQHATSIDAVLTALSTQAVIVGTEWREDMFSPDSQGLLRITGDVAGGHEYVLDELNMEDGTIGMQNSWNDSWGLHGRAYFHIEDFESLLAADGDCTVFVPITQPAPTPTPPEPKPNYDDADYALSQAAHRWLNRCPFFYRSFQGSLKDWLTAKGL